MRSKGTMVLTFILGTLFAVGHHLYYNHLAGQVPPDTQYGVESLATLTGQQINLAIGAIFVFFAKSSFDAAIFTAHEQTTWKAIKNSRQSTKTVTIDGLLTSKDNLLSLFQPDLWRRSFLSMALAIFSWYVVNLLSTHYLDLTCSVELLEHLGKRLIVTKAPHNRFLLPRLNSHGSVPGHSI